MSKKCNCGGSCCTSKITETVSKEGSKWVVRSKSGKKLGTHTSKKDADAQLQAIHISQKKEQVMKNKQGFEPEADSRGKYTGRYKAKLTDKDSDTLAKVADILKKEKKIKRDDIIDALAEILKERYGAKKLKELTVKVKADDLDKIKNKLDPEKDQIEIVPEQEEEDDDSWVDQAIKDYEEMTGNKYTRNDDDLEKGIYEKEVRRGLKDIVHEAVYEILQEEILPTSSQRILGKFPTLKKTLINLMTNEFNSFVNDILWISPKPTTFQINLNNGQSYYLKWLGQGFEAEISGKKYYLTTIGEYQQALDAIGDLLKYTPSGIEDFDSGEEFGAGGGFGEEPGAGDFGQEELGEEEPSPEETDFT